jgi:hypothetical protein
MPPPPNDVEPIEGPPQIMSSAAPPNPAMDFSGPKMPPPPPLTARKPVPQKIGDLDRTPYGVTPPTDTDKDESSVSDKIAALDKPEAPHSNWAQRLAQILLGVTKVGPQAAAAIVHPKYTEQRRAYDQQVSDIYSGAKAKEAEDASAALVSQREANAAYKTSVGADDALKVKNAADAKKATLLEKQQQDAFKFGSMGGKLQDASAPVPDGFIAVPKLDDPTKQWVVAPAKTHFTVNASFKKMAEDAGIGGLEVGQLVDRDTWKTVAEINAKKSIQDAKPDRRLTTSDLAIKAAGGDPNDPESVTTDIANSAVNRMKPPREQRAPGFAELKYQDQKKAMHFARQALNDVTGIDKSDRSKPEQYDYAIQNVKNPSFYVNSPLRDADEDDIVSAIEHLREQGLKGKVLENRANNISRGAQNEEMVKKFLGGPAKPKNGGVAPKQSAAVPPTPPAFQHIPAHGEIRTKNGVPYQYDAAQAQWVRQPHQ